MKGRIVICDYCGTPADFVDSSVVYHGHSFGMIYLCPRCGAYVGVHKANNLASTLDELKERGVWLFGAEADGTVGLYDAPFDRPTAIIIGSEGQGLSRLTRDKCDYIVSIPMRGRVNSLNASNAAAVLLFEALRRRTQGN